MPSTTPSMPSAGRPAAQRAAEAQAVAWLAGRRLRRELATAEDCGYFGPGSAMWLLHREAVLGLGLGRALLLQLAHPWVAQAVADHSAFAERPLDRLVGTVSAAELLVFGSRRQADATATMLRRMHGRLAGTLRMAVGAWPAGTAYRADDPDALLWVLVTLLDTAIRLYEAGLGRLRDDMLCAYLAEGARLGTLLGVDAGSVPGDRAALERYIAGMIGSGRVAVGPIARRLARTLLHAQVLPGLQWRTYSLLTRAVAAATLPEALQHQYSPLISPGAWPFLHAGRLVGRALLPVLPDQVRLDPIAAIAIRGAARHVATGDPYRERR